MTRSHHPRWHRARALAALAVPLALAAGVLPASGTALAQPATPATTPTSTPATTTAPAGTGEPADQQAQPLSLPALHDDSYTVTLLTGDQVRLTATGVGRYTVVATPATGHDTVIVNASSGPDGVKTLQAAPSAAQFLVASGQVDKGLFDVRYLASNGYTDGANKPIPVTVQYTDRADTDTMTRRADSLPASSVAATDARTGTADLRVDAHHVADFWAALTNTGATATTGMSSSGLADGIAHVWLTGHRAADQTVRPDADTGQPTYPLTVTMTLEVGALGNNAMRCNLALVTMCGPGGIAIQAIDGDNAGQGYGPAWECLDHDPCTTLRARQEVPAGNYTLFANGILFWIDGHRQVGWVVAPQVEVNGATDVEFDLSRMRHIDFTTPKPIQAFSNMIQWQRDLPDGTAYTSFGWGGWGALNDWVLPTDQPVTLGSFHFATEWLLGKPPVTARVDGPKGFDLHPMYYSYNTSANNGNVVRFSGRQHLQVVDAGNGQAEDFAGIDARGKLVIMRTRCAVSKTQYDNAMKAGAAGVLIDPRAPVEGDPGAPPTFVCLLPIAYHYDSETPPDVPYAAITPSDAIRLDGLLGHGDVWVTITDSGPSPYTYNLKFYSEGGMPGSPHYTVDNDQLTAVDTRLHADSPARADQTIAAWRPNEFLIGGVPSSFTWPAKRTEYYGPASPDLVYSRGWTVPWDPDFSSIEVFDQRGGHRTEDIDARPASPGPFGYDPKVPAAQQPPNRFAQLCALCRQGNALSPAVDLGQGDRPMSAGASLDPDTTHLYLGDKEIPQTSTSGVNVFPAYMLPPEQHTYRLVTDYDNAGFGHTHADWTFSSAAPGHNQVPPGTFCHGNPDDPCRADPIVFLSYDLGVALDNTLSAPSVGMFTVTASHQAADGPAIRDLKLWTSTDDGQHWKQALVLPRDRGEHGARDFSVLTGVPWLSQTTGALSIKAQATDAEGNSITETLTQAVKLTQRTGWGWPGHRIWQ